MDYAAAFGHSSAQTNFVTHPDDPMISYQEYFIQPDTIDTVWVREMQPVPVQMLILVRALLVYTPSLRVRDAPCKAPEVVPTVEQALSRSLQRPSRDSWPVAR